MRVEIHWVILCITKSCRVFWGGEIERRITGIYVQLYPYTPPPSPRSLTNMIPIQIYTFKKSVYTRVGLITAGQNYWWELSEYTQRMMNWEGLKDWRNVQGVPKKVHSSVNQTEEGTFFGTPCTLGCVENGNQSVIKNLLAFFAAFWYID